MPATRTAGAVDPAAVPDIARAAASVMRAEGLQPYAWENGGGYTYAPHRHPYHKVLYCTRGSIRFDLTEEGQSVTLVAGDRLDLEAGAAHAAFVGQDGVACLEAPR